jgi:hypothetical protein
MREGCVNDLSFGSWSVADDLPFHDNDITSFELNQPYGDLMEDPAEGESVPVGVPCHPSFPPSGVVLVPVRSCPNGFTSTEPTTGREVHFSPPPASSISEHVLVDSPVSLECEPVLIDPPSLFAGEYSTPDLPFPEAAASFCFSDCTFSSSGSTTLDL